ncbi:MAG: hypothetical protein ACXW27_05605 [Allosphingosinicella sp.]
MLDLFTTAAVVLGGAFGLGVFLDQYTSEEIKDRLWKNLQGVNKAKIASSAVNVVVISYESVFTGKIGTWRFFWRSIAGYIVLLFLGFGFLALFFPGMFLTSISAYISGDVYDAAVVTALHAAGGLVFWAANAQTLYFLRLAQVDPRPTPIFLIFYADALLTASICVFGIGALFWLQSFAYLENTTREVSLQIRVHAADEALRNDLARYRTSSAGVAAMMLSSEIKIQAERLAKASAILTRNVPSQNAQKIVNRDLELAAKYYPRSGIPVRRLDEDTIQFLGPQGEVRGFYSISDALDSEWGRTFESDITRSEICRQLLNPVPSLTGRYTRVSQIRYVQGWDAKACNAGKEGTIRATVAINRSNVSATDLATGNVQLVFQNLVTSVATGFRTYASVHPSYFFDPDRSSAVWIHEHVISEREEAAINRLDQAFLDALLAEDGAKTNILNRSIAGGTLISAIMATPFFTILMLISAMGAISLANAATALTRLEGIFLIRKHPFVSIMVAAGMLALLFRLSFL